ncbi:MAG TPA: glutathione S-transferase family protein [Steroidobacteraceae bacterium]|jgi:glutathione S-transferase|nr:glutathione S-transferase family protein [Steroidobacteraceae bacterium]
MLELYHAGPGSNSFKVLLCLYEKRLEFVGHLLNIRSFEQHEPWFLEINPDGQVPVLVHDGAVITESTVINEYLDQVFAQVPLRPADPLECARMRLFTKYVDEYFRPALSNRAWQEVIHLFTDQLPPEELAAKLARIPREEKRKKWRMAVTQSFPPEQLAAWRRTLEEGVQKMERALSSGPWLAGPHFSLADIAMFSMAAGMPHNYGDFMNARRAPRTMDWHDRMSARPSVQAARRLPTINYRRPGAS